MTKKRVTIITVICALAVGFAAVATNLVINGNIAIGANKKEFDVYFSEARLNDKLKNSLIKDDTHIVFEYEMSLVDEEMVLEYAVTNGSKNYDANLTLNVPESNEYLEIFNDFDTDEVLPATETRYGSLYIRLKKPYVGTEEEPTKDLSITIEIIANAVERESLSDGVPSPKVQACTLENPTVMSIGDYGWIWTDNDCNEELSIGDLLTKSTESFYIYDVDEYDYRFNNKYKAISQYNLHVGNTVNMDESGAPLITQLENPTGLQSSDAIGARFEGTTPILFPWVGTVPFMSQTKIDTLTEEQKPNDYSISDIKKYVDEYANKLYELGVNRYNTNVRLITKEELDAAGCDSEKTSCKTGYVLSNGNWLKDETFVGTSMEFLYSTSYWTSSPSAEYGSGVWGVYSNGICGWSSVSHDVTLGVRPVIELDYCSIHGCPPQ